jgi:hypothetical protein
MHKKSEEAEEVLQGWSSLPPEVGNQSREPLNGLGTVQLVSSRGREKVTRQHGCTVSRSRTLRRIGGPSVLLAGPIRGTAQFRPENGSIGRGRETEADSIPQDGHHSKADLVADENLFADLAGQDQHERGLLSSSVGCNGDGVSIGTAEFRGQPARLGDQKSYQPALEHAGDLECCSPNLSHV